MKKILTKEARGRKETRNKIIIGLLLVALMLLSTIGYAFFYGSEEKKRKLDYNGIEFVLENNFWRFKVQNFEFLTYFNPKETENISVPIFITVNNYVGKPLFFVGEGTAKQEIGRNLQNFVLRVNNGCLEDYEDICEENTRMKNCSEDNMIILEEEGHIEIRQEENCIFISSPYEEQTRTADAFLFKILGIRSF